MDCQELLNVIYICFAIYRTGGISPFIIMGIATTCWTHNYVANTLPMLSYLIFTIALSGIFIHFPHGELGHREVKWFGQDHTASKSESNDCILDLSDSKVHALSPVTYGSVLSKRLSSWCKHSKCMAAKRLASFQQPVRGRMTKKDKYYMSEVKVYNLSRTYYECS